MERQVFILTSNFLQKGKDVEEATWTMLNKKEALRQNDAWLLKLTCNKLHCYNPWRGEVLI